jgi:pimeloyl-ACP methyl ester carboxylesterase
VFTNGQVFARIVAYSFAAVTAACAHASPPIPAPGPIAFAGGTIYVDDAPGGETPILFIHGNGGSTQTWKAQLEHFRTAGRRAVAIDLPGFGRSTPPSDWSLSAMAAAVDAAVTSAGLSHFVIVGHSYGGAVVAAYAAAHPNKVAGVVYLDAAASALPLTAEQKAQFGAALRADKMTVVRAWFAPTLVPSTQRVRNEVFSDAEKTSADALVGALMSLGDFDAKTLVNAFQGPKVAIVAADLEGPASFQRQFSGHTRTQDRRHGALDHARQARRAVRCTRRVHEGGRRRRQTLESPRDGMASARPHCARNASFGSMRLARSVGSRLHRIVLSA